MLKYLSKYIFHPLDDLRNNSNRLKYLRFFQDSQFWSEARLQDWQFQQLKKILIHAYETVPFYKNRFRECDFDPYQFKNFDQLLSIPYLTKSEIQENLNSLVSQRYKIQELVPNLTGGSTGSPLRFFHDKERIYYQEASTLRHNRWTGYDLGEKLAAIWGHRLDIDAYNSFKKKLRNFILDRHLVLDASSMDIEVMKDFLIKLKRYRPKFILAYANSIYLFAKFLKSYDNDNLGIKAIISSAEMLTPEARNVVEETFQCPVFDRYGCREVSIISSECDCHSGMHINSEALYVEFIKNNHYAPVNEFGNIIITDMLNYGMPFIRYKIEDVGTPLGNICNCGRNLPLMNIYGGRVTDFIVTPEGKYVSGASLTIYLVAKVPGLVQAQIVQEEVGQVTFRLVKGKDFSKNSLNFIKKEIPSFFGEKMKYDFEFVDHIPLTQSGKYLFSISKVKPEF